MENAHYCSKVTAGRIKERAKEKDILIKDLLEKCQLGKNTLSTMVHRGSWIQAVSIAKIADILDCSVDFLLGRTNKPEINK